jgi:hypothetical protein
VKQATHEPYLLLKQTSDLGNRQEIITLLKGSVNPVVCDRLLPVKLNGGME